jgi:CHAT domain-containing protein/Flp pilus assembly protein TadD
MEAKLGKDHIGLANVLTNLAAIAKELGHFDEAEALHKRGLAIRRARLDGNHPDIAVALNGLAGLYQYVGRFAEAEELFVKAVKIYDSGAGKPQALALTLSNLGHLYTSLGRYDEAESCLDRCLIIQEASLGKEHPNVAVTLGKRALLYDATGQYREAESLLLRSISLLEAKLGKEHHLLGTQLASLGKLYGRIGRYAEAESLLRRALKLIEAKLGKDHVEVAGAAYNLAKLYLQMGRAPEAEALLGRSCRIYESKLGEKHAGVADCLDSIGRLAWSRRRLDEAEKLMRRSLDIRVAFFGKTHQKVGESLNVLAGLYKKTSRFPEAELLYLESRRIAEAVFGKDHPAVASSLLNLADLYRKMERFKDAEPLYQRGLDLTEAGYGKKHSLYALGLGSLAGLRQTERRPREALKLQQESMDIEQALVDQVFAFSSEPAMQDFLDTINLSLPNLISMVASSEPAASDVADGFTWTMRRKGVILDALCRFRQAQRLLDPDDALSRQVTRYRSLKELLARTALQPPRGISPEQLKKQLAQWRQEADTLEGDLNRALARKHPELLAASDRITTAAVQAVLPPDAALVEFVRSPIRNFKASPHDAIWQKARYFAFVLSSGKSAPQLIDLGDARNIDAAVDGLRQQFADFQERLQEAESPEEIRDLEKAQEKKYRQVSFALHRRLFAPLAKALGPARFVYLAPDGDLNRLPFEALVDTQGKYLIETYRFAYLSSGRDLLREPVKPAHGTVVFAGPDFQLDSSKRLSQAQRVLGKRAVPLTRGQTQTSVRGLGWKPLPGAAAEAGDIQKILGGGPYSPVTCYLGTEALEEVLKAMPPPRALHLATHGFYLDRDPDTPVLLDEPGAAPTRGRLKLMDDPLLRSGIVLAGANAIGDDGATAGSVDDGWVTAGEIAFLNLRGTELVVLSACQTGLGEVRNGEGVYGLRRAFLHAGARTLVTSLFEVPDSETRDLMKRFYTGLQAGQGKLAALHTAQFELLRQRRQMHGAAHPFFWASFVLVGDPQ